MRLLLAFSMVALALQVACVQRPPPIKSPPGPPPVPGQQCTVSHGIDTAGNPGCSTGCTWNPAQGQCMPDAPPGWVPPNGA